MPWYVIRTKSHQEKAAAFHLRQVCAEVLMPEIMQRRVMNGHPKSMVEPLFPGYLFAQFELQEKYRAVKFARGVLNIVEFGMHPAEVEEATIQALKGHMKNGYVQVAGAPFQEGQVVRITGGPLAGLEAVFLRSMEKQQRVCVLLNMLGLQTKMTMNSDQISLPQAL